jgi:hypothetical protein
VEIDALEQALEYDRTVQTARWIDPFGKTYGLRTLYCGLFSFFYTTSGNSFYGAYGPRVGDF